MKRIFLVLTVLILSAAPALADFQAGLDAYNRKDYATALREWKPLGEQGDADAQLFLGLMYDQGQGVAQNYGEAVNWYRKAAEQGYARAQINLGVMYAGGQGVARDYAEAANWYRKAADQGHASAQSYLAGLYIKGAGVQQNIAEAARWYRKAAEQDLRWEDQLVLGLMYYNGQGVAQDYTEAVKWFLKATNPHQNVAGELSEFDTKFPRYSPAMPMAEYFLGIMSDNGQGVVQDYAEAIKWYRKAADKGHATALFNLGSHYYNGQGVAQDYSEAVKWYRKAADSKQSFWDMTFPFSEVADQGVAQAQFYLGTIYENGQGVPMDSEEAIKWYRKAAERGHADAQFNLGITYNIGWPVLQDHIEAIKWYRLAAEQGHEGAQFYLGFNYDRGEGVAQDYTEAVKWYRKAAEQGYASAQSNLGNKYAKGQGVPQDYAEAVKWNRRAAEQGQPDALFSLGNMYAKGQGVHQDYALAYIWYSLAAATQGIKEAAYARDRVAKFLTPDQIAEGQKMARNWQPTQSAVKQPQSTASVPRPTASPPAVVVPDMAGLQRQLKKIEGPIAKSPKPVAAPQPTLRPEFPTRPIAVRFPNGPRNPNDIAVIIGNADYNKGKDIPNVTPAYADAEGIKNYVTQALGIRQENIIFLKDAGQSELTATFGSKENHKGQLFNYVKAGKSRVFVYYSGHGAPGGDGGSSYIVPTDAQASLIDLNGYSLKTLYKNLSKIPAKSVTVVLEACFSGSSQSGSVIAKASPIYLKAKETGVPSNITVISAGAANQIASWEQDSSSGLFTKYFLKGMSGEADAKPYGNGDGKVGYDELGRYFKETLTYYARRYYGREQTAQIMVGAER